MINRKKALKVKVKHLASEARIIRTEEKRSDVETRGWLNAHRKHVVRPEARATHIAYAFAKGIPLHKVEKYPQSIPSHVWARVNKMVAAYSNKPRSEFIEWISDYVNTFQKENISRIGMVA